MFTLEAKLLHVEGKASSMLNSGALHTHPRFLHFWYVHVEGLVDLLNVQQQRVLNPVQKLTAGDAHSVATEIPIIEHPRRDNPLIISVTLKTVVLTIVLAQLSLTKDYKRERERERERAY